MVIPSLIFIENFMTLTVLLNISLWFLINISILFQGCWAVISMVILIIRAGWLEFFKVIHTFSLHVFDELSLITSAWYVFFKQHFAENYLHGWNSSPHSVVLCLAFDSALFYIQRWEKSLLPSGSVKLWVGRALRRMTSGEVLELRFPQGMLPCC